MQMRKLGFSDLNLSVIGLGTWAIGGAGYECSLGAQDDQESVRTIRKAIDDGINWIDTAPMYGLGHAEEVIGKAIGGIRSQVHVATKSGILWDEKKSFRFCLKKDSTLSDIQATLRRIDTDYIDLYQIHTATPEEEIEEGWHCISELIREGKVRYAGVSNFSLEQIKKVQKIHPVASIQPVYNMFNRDIEQGIMDYCAQNRIGVISYSPLCSGLITDGISRERLKNLAENDFRPRLPDFQEPLLSAHLKAIERLKPVAARRGLTLPQLAIAWVLRQGDLTSAIVGARCIDHIDEIVKAGELVMVEEDLMEIEAILAGPQAESKEVLTPYFTRVISRIWNWFLTPSFHWMRSAPVCRRNTEQA
jgi:aryl-alcohol dehydrogenase-like predicted oxidoreductase